MIIVLIFFLRCDRLGHFFSIVVMLSDLFLLCFQVAKLTSVPSSQFATVTNTLHSTHATDVAGCVSLISITIQDLFLGFCLCEHFI
jgi:hypothetical protein